MNLRDNFFVIILFYRKLTFSTMKFICTKKRQRNKLGSIVSYKFILNMRCFSYILHEQINDIQNYLTRGVHTPLLTASLDNKKYTEIHFN